MSQNTTQRPRQIITNATRMAVEAELAALIGKRYRQCSSPERYPTEMSLAEFMSEHIMRRLNRAWEEGRESGPRETNPYSTAPTIGDMP
jgi:hypothetical protein